MLERCICIHGHFYQPPRENPWLEDVELQDSAAPFHDWNERIAFECYARNAAARILDHEGRIRKIINNYSRISFDFGPTLLDWLESKEPKVYRSIIEADAESQKLFSGHGSAIAQAYNHMIMPLASRWDKYTQIYWGIKDFEHRFKRKPEGMWLPETAVDLETLELMAEQGILFTILSPYQARRVRKIGSETWTDVGPGGIDPTMPYKLNFRNSGRSINLFFYNGPVSNAVAFQDLLRNGEHFAERLLESYSRDKPWPQLVHIATDGETFGHHHRHGEMALAYALDYITTRKRARITNYGEHLEKYPPLYEVEIRENTSWSCTHGIERWRNDCGCKTGKNPDWKQNWRTVLRIAFDWLRKTLDPLYEEYAGRFLKDPWKARNDYILAILDRSTDNVHHFLKIQSARTLGPSEQITVLKLLEMQRHGMLMYTSCGWFFDDISGIETVQALQYAARVIQLADELFNKPLENSFLKLLSEAKSNNPKYIDGANVYKKLVKPAMIDLPEVAAHYSISSLFESYGEQAVIFCYNAEKKEHQHLSAGRAKLAVGRVQVTSQITWESATFSYGVVHFGNHNLSGCIKTYSEAGAYKKMVQELVEAFWKADLPEVNRIISHCVEGVNFSLKQLFRDKQREILNLILNSTIEEIESDYQRFYERHATLMHFLRYLNIPQPKALLTTAEFVLNARLRTALGSNTPDPAYLRTLLEEARVWGIQFEKKELSHVLEQTLSRKSEQLKDNPTDISLIKNLLELIEISQMLPFDVDFWQVQNIYYMILVKVYPNVQMRTLWEEKKFRKWQEYFLSLGDKLLVRTERESWDS